ncbi:MAG: hypothetical protein FWE53_04050 [Firmicutes bacterium]|nr:hypothetical protein [Bacillota bacterium]
MAKNKDKKYINLYNKNTGKLVAYEKEAFSQYMKLRMYSLKYGVKMEEIKVSQIPHILSEEW